MARPGNPEAAPGSPLHEGGGAPGLPQRILPSGEIFSQTNVVIPIDTTGQIAAIKTELTVIQTGSVQHPQNDHQDNPITTLQREIDALQAAVNAPHSGLKRFTGWWGRNKSIRALKQAEAEMVRLKRSEEKKEGIEERKRKDKRFKGKRSRQNVQEQPSNIRSAGRISFGDNASSGSSQQASSQQASGGETSRRSRERIALAQQGQKRRMGIGKGQKDKESTTRITRKPEVSLATTSGNEPVSLVVESSNEGELTGGSAESLVLRERRPDRHERRVQQIRALIDEQDDMVPVQAFHDAVAAGDKKLAREIYYTTVPGDVLLSRIGTTLSRVDLAEGYTLQDYPNEHSVLVAIQDVIRADLMFIFRYAQTPGVYMTSHQVQKLYEILFPGEVWEREDNTPRAINNRIPPHILRFSEDLEGIRIAEGVYVAPVRSNAIDLGARQRTDFAAVGASFPRLFEEGASFSVLQLSKESLSEQQLVREGRGGELTVEDIYLGITNISYMAQELFRNTSLRRKYRGDRTGLATIDSINDLRDLPRDEWGQIKH